MCCVNMHLTSSQTATLHEACCFNTQLLCTVCCLFSFGDMVHNTEIRSAHEDHAIPTITSVLPMAAAFAATVK